jgi:uncharacterized damage-inducible protein DinB
MNLAMPGASSGGGTTELVAELADALGEFNDASRRGRDSFGSLDREQFNRRPSEESWSVAECLDHLCTIADSYIPLVKDAVSRGKTGKLFSRGPFRHARIWEWLIRLAGEYPPRIRAKAPRMFRPASDHDPERLLKRFCDLQNILSDLAQQADGLHLSRIRLSSPLTRWVKMTLGQVFRFLAAHQKRHLGQAEHVLRQFARV